MMFDYSSLFETKEKTNEEQLQAICDKYESDIDAGDFKWFAFEVAVKCGAVALKKSGERLDCDLISLIAETYFVIDDVVFSADKKELVKYAPEKKNACYEIPNYVERIRDNAFENNQYITELDILENVKHIGSGAFKNCKNLSKIKWQGAKSSGSYVFVDCPSLKKIYTNDINDFWNYGCDNLGSPFINGAELYVDDTLCESITVPENIGQGTIRAFKGCSSIKTVCFSGNNTYIEKLLLNIIEDTGNA